MKQMLFYCLTVMLFSGCKKEHGPKVEIYLLKSFTVAVDQTTRPATTSITNAVLADTPLVADRDIKFYTRATTTFTLWKDIQSVIVNYGPDKGFAVTVDHQPVYFGQFRPLYLSSLVFGLAFIAPLRYNNDELKIDFLTIDGSGVSSPLDKRNESRVINALQASDKLR